MRVAIIENNTEIQDKIRNSLSITHRIKGGIDPSWVIDFFIDPEKFFDRESSDYDIILVDCDAGREKVCFDFIHKIYDTTDAELCILTDSTDQQTLASLLVDEHINSILNKRDLNTIVEHLKYYRSRKRIKNHLINESALYSTITSQMF